MSNKQQLKPLNHKKYINNGEHLGKNPLSKELIKPETASPSTKPAITKKASNGEPYKAVKLQRTAQRSIKTVEHYDCDDFDYEL